jgi:archaellum component FlaF (FlaF/FlaG flagellin family)
MLGSRKGLSEILSALMMTSMVVAMFAVIFVTYVPALRLTESQSSLWYGDQENSARERVVVEMLTFLSSPKKIEVFVRNVGKTDVKVAAVYVNGVPITGPDITPSLTGGYRIYTKTGSSQHIVKFTLVYVWTSGVEYTVKVVTARGNSATAMARA